MKSLHADPAVELIAADMDPWAAGLYLQPPGARTLLPAGRSPAFVTVLLERCLDLAVDIVVPTVDAELRPLAAARSVLARAGVALMLAAPQSRADARQAGPGAALRGYRPRPPDRTAHRGPRSRFVDLPGHRQATDRQRIGGHLAGRVGGRAGRPAPVGGLHRAGLPAGRRVLDRRAG
jgi:carbamoyl-phosphate synthase large subunit